MSTFILLTALHFRTLGRLDKDYSNTGLEYKASKNEDKTQIRSCCVSCQPSHYRLSEDGHTPFQSMEPHIDYQQASPALTIAGYESDLHEHQQSGESKLGV